MMTRDEAAQIAARNFGTSAPDLVMDWVIDAMMVAYERGVASVARPPPQPRHTQIGVLPVDVNTIDKLDAVLAATLDTLKNSQAAEKRLHAQINDAAPAVEYAAACLAERNHVAGERGYIKLRQRRRSARKAYEEHMERSADDSA